MIYADTTPTIDSILNCTAPDPAHVGDAISCTIHARDSNGPVYSAASDFSVSSSSSDLSGLTAESDGQIFTFTTTPQFYDPLFQITVMTASAPIQFGVQTFDIFGFPSTLSTVSCTGTFDGFMTGADTVEPSALLSCTITVLDASGNITSGLPSDFSVNTSVSAGPVSRRSNSAIELVSSENGTELLFNVTAPSQRGEIFNVSVSLANGTSLVQPPLEFYVACLVFLSLFCTLS